LLLVRHGHPSRKRDTNGKSFWIFFLKAKKTLRNQWFIAQEKNGANETEENPILKYPTQMSV
jgi:hypothetical protein